MAGRKRPLFVAIDRRLVHLAVKDNGGGEERRGFAAACNARYKSGLAGQLPEQVVTPSTESHNRSR